MATVDEKVQKNEERRKRVFVGRLPEDFLRINTTNPRDQQEAADIQAALALQQQLVGVPYSHNIVGRLNLTVVQAKLVKNYGITRMDPYVRLRVGHSIYETHTDTNGSRNPKWNRDVQCLLPQGVTSIYIEIYDERSFTVDELIAHAQINIPSGIFNGETTDDWYPLSGKQGEGVEGMIQIVMSFLATGGQYPAAAAATPMVVGVPVATPGPFGFSTIRSVPVTYTNSPAPFVAAPPLIKPNPEDLKQIEDMFPNMDKDVIKSVYEVNRFNKDLTVNSLLSMSD